MKKLLILSIAFVLLLHSCKKVDKYTNFYITVTDSFYLNPVNAKDNIVDVWLFKTNNNIHEKFTEYNTDVGQTEKIAFSLFNLSITENDLLYNYDIETIEVYIDAMDHDQMLIAWNYDIKSTQDSIIELDFSDANIKDYVFNNYKVMYIKVRVLNNYNIDIKFDIQYRLYISSELNET